LDKVYLQLIDRCLFWRWDCRSCGFNYFLPGNPINGYFLRKRDFSPLAGEARGCKGGETLLGFAAQRLRTVFAVHWNTDSREDLVNLILWRVSAKLKHGKK